MNGNDVAINIHRREASCHVSTATTHQFVLFRNTGLDGAVKQTWMSTQMRTRIKPSDRNCVGTKFWHARGKTSCTRVSVLYLCPHLQNFVALLVDTVVLSNQNSVILYSDYISLSYLCVQSSGYVYGVPRALTFKKSALCSQHSMFVRH